MNATIIADQDYQTELFKKLNSLLTTCLNNRGFKTELISIGRNDLAFCKGCFGCWIKKPGECTINDMMAQINRSFVNSDTVVYLSPVIFGQFSANIKNALDRWLPNMLPFFETRPDGSTMHPPRYDALPHIVIIGYGDELSVEDVQLFIDITKRHRRNTEVLIFQGSDDDIAEALTKTQLGKAGRQL